MKFIMEFKGSPENVRQYRDDLVKAVLPVMEQMDDPGHLMLTGRYEDVDVDVEWGKSSQPDALSV